jgi:diguanylate cyclase (GGDEF)-like protein
VPHDAANIALLDEQNVVHFERVRGYEKLGLHNFVSTFAAPLERFPNWVKVYETRQPLIITDTLKYAEWVRTPESAWICSFACAPIVTKDKVIGLLNLDSGTSGFFNTEHAERLMIFANQAAVAIEKARLFSETQRLAITDGLTGIYNRRHVLDLLEMEIERAQRYQRPLSTILFDIDHFKEVNDRFGHPAGDLVLCKLIELCRRSLRTNDSLGRYGGEEFLIIAPETNLQDALEIAERLRKQVEDLQIPTEKGVVNLTISLGAAAFSPGSKSTLEDLITRTDDALYTAKRLGRNSVSGLE